MKNPGSSKDMAKIPNVSVSKPKDAGMAPSGKWKTEDGVKVGKNPHVGGGKG